MGGRKSNSKIGGYKGVECQDLEKELSTNLPLNNTPIYSPNPFRVIGVAKISKSGQSLSIKITDDGRERFFTILLSDVFAMAENQTKNIVTCSVREYDNIPKTE